MARFKRTRGWRASALLASVTLGLTLAAQPASADIMRMTRTLKIMGVNDGSIEDLVDTDLVLQVTYDTDLGMIQDDRHPQFGGNYGLSNSNSPTNPLLTASYTLGTETFDAFVADSAFLTFFNFSPGFQTQHNVTFAGARDGRVFDISLNGILNEGDDLPADFTQPLQRDVLGYGLFNFDHGDRSGTLFFNDEAFTPVGRLTIERLDVAAVPEPTTWALMISGFGLAGMTLRQRRRVAA